MLGRCSAFFYNLIGRPCDIRLITNGRRTIALQPWTWDGCTKIQSVHHIYIFVMLELWPLLFPSKTVFYEDVNVPELDLIGNPSLSLGLKFVDHYLSISIQIFVYIRLTLCDTSLYLVHKIFDIWFWFCFFIIDNFAGIHFYPTCPFQIDSRLKSMIKKDVASDWKVQLLHLLNLNLLPKKKRKGHH